MLEKAPGPQRRPSALVPGGVIGPPSSFLGPWHGLLSRPPRPCPISVMWSLTSLFVRPYFPNLPAQRQT